MIRGVSNNIGENISLDLRYDENIVLVPNLFLRSCDFTGLSELGGHGGHLSTHFLCLEYLTRVNKGRTDYSKIFVKGPSINDVSSITVSC